MMGPWDDPCEIMTIRIPKASLFGNSGLRGIYTLKSYVILS